MKSLLRSLALFTIVTGGILLFQATLSWMNSVAAINAFDAAMNPLHLPNGGMPKTVQLEGDDLTRFYAMHRPLRQAVEAAGATFFLAVTLWVISLSALVVLHGISSDQPPSTAR